MKILLAGLAGNREIGLYERNLGNTVILIPILHYLKKYFPEAVLYTTIQLTDKFLSKFGKNINVISGPIWPMGKLRSCFYILKAASKYIFNRSQYKSYDFILNLNGDVFCNTRYKAMLLCGIFEILAAKRGGVRVIEWVSSPGPFDTVFHKLVGKFFYNNIDLIINRESKSREYLDNINVKTPVIDAGCPSWLLDSCYTPISKVDGIGIVPSASTCSLPARQQELLQVAMHFADQGNRIYILPHSHIKEDIHICFKLYNMMVEYGITPILLQERDVQAVKCWMGNLKMLVTGRLHAGVNALTKLVPTVFLSYSHKFNMVDDVGIICNEDDSLLEKCKACNKMKVDKFKLELLKTKSQASFEALYYYVSGGFVARNYYVRNLEKSLESVPIPDRGKLYVIKTVLEFDAMIKNNDFSSMLPILKKERDLIKKKRGILFCLTINNKFANKIWVITDNDISIKLIAPIELAEHEATTERGRTAEEFRRLNAYTYVHNEIFKYLKERGFKKARMLIDANNKPPQKAQIKLGSDFICTMYQK